jgi:hypothetical protein
MFLYLNQESVTCRIIRGEWVSGAFVAVEVSQNHPSAFSHLIFFGSRSPDAGTLDRAESSKTGGTRLVESLASQTK